MLCRAALASWAGFGYHARARSVAACSRKGLNISSCVRGGVCASRGHICPVSFIPFLEAVATSQRDAQRSLHSEHLTSP